MIKIEHLTKNYSGLCALNDVSFEIQKGEILGLLGHNGAGKTTLMRIITGYMPASYGSVKVKGKDVFDHPKEVKQLIGYLPENCPLYPDMSVRDFLISMGELKGLRGKKLQERFDYVLEAVKIKDKSNSIIGILSKGYRQRVGLAQALIHDPEILILDEPTVGLDPSQIIEIRDLIKDFKGNRTVILSTHILPEVSQTCERIIIISDGAIAAEGTEAELINQLSGDQKVHVQVQNNQVKAVGVIKDIAGVIDVQIKNGVIEIEVEKTNDLRPEIAKKLVENNIELTELRKEQITLENIFIRLTQGN